MKWSILTLALALAIAGGGPRAFGQSSSPAAPTQAPSQPQSSSAAGRAEHTDRSGSRPDDKALGSGTTTGAAAPNTTGSSGSSGTSGVDSSTANSH
jgi:hypothetical protein